MTPVFRVEHSSAEPHAWAVAGPRPDDWREQWARTLALVRGVCAWCGSTGADTVEHDTADALRAVHRACVGHQGTALDPTATTDTPLPRPLDAIRARVAARRAKRAVL